MGGVCSAGPGCLRFPVSGPSAEGTPDTDAQRPRVPPGRTAVGAPGTASHYAVSVTEGVRLVWVSPDTLKGSRSREPFGQKVGGEALD